MFGMYFLFNFQYTTYFRGVDECEGFDYIEYLQV